MSHAPRYSDRDLEPLRAALLALAAGDTFRAPSAAAGPDVPNHGVLSQIWSLADGVAIKLATLSDKVRRKSEFLANMSHELRTPLNSLLVLAQLLSENPDGNLTVEQVEFAKTIHDAGADLLQLINDILDLSKVEAGKMDVHLAPVAVGELLDYLDATFRPTATQQGLAFAAGVSPDVPAVIFADEQRLQQVLRNLLSNAVKFTHRGGVVLRVALAAADTRFTGPLGDEQTVLAFAVTDTGIGIAEEKLEQIFGAFQQADGTTSRGYGGTGLGLSISRDIARLLGGEIHATSRPGRGSTFTFYLPDRREAFEEEFNLSRTSRDFATSRTVSVVAGGIAGTTGPFEISETRGADHGTGGTAEPLAAGAQPREVFARAPAPRDGDPLNGAKILIVDDDVRNLFALTSVFELYGSVVRQAADGRAGIEILDSEPDVALVLMDVMMPELDGYATTAAIRRRGEFAGLPIVMVTAKAMEGDRTKAIASGASEYVAKPVDIEHLVGLMRALLSGTAAVLDGS
jgi:signal transduction histidine kinase/ActR/RegA family two-component response regulator